MKVKGKFLCIVLLTKLLVCPLLWKPATLYYEKKCFQIFPLDSRAISLFLYKDTVYDRLNILS